MNRWPIALIVRLARAYRRCGFSRSAAALAYFLLLTLFPLLVCVSHFMGLLYPGLTHLLQPLRQFLPAEVLRLLEDYLAYAAQNHSPPLFWAALFTILFSASAGLRTLFLTLDQLFDHRPRRPLLRFLFSPVLALLLLITVYLSITVVFTGDWFFLFLGRHLPQLLLDRLPLAALARLWSWTRYLLLFCAMLLLILMVYRVGIPRASAGNAPLTAASAAAALALVVCSAVFSWVLELSTRYRLVYGSLAGLILLLVWLYACGLILLLGAALLEPAQ